MKTVREAASQITDLSKVMHQVHSSLLKLDPQYAELAEHYCTAAEMLTNTFGSAGEMYLTAIEQIFSTEVLSLCWSGFYLRFQIFQNPVVVSFLGEDFDVILQEHRLRTIPALQRYTREVEAFSQDIPEEILNSISEYYAYLQTVGYKLAHYYGFLLADKVFDYVIPGYCRDDSVSERYKARLTSYLNINITELGF